MSSLNYDFIVLGAGSGGLASAKRAAAHGAKVAIVEDSRVGGTCVIRGCVPKKLMYYGAALGKQSQLAEGYGWAHVNREHSWEHLVAMRDNEVARLEVLHQKWLKNAGVDLLIGRGRLVGPHEVEVAGTTYPAEHIMIATGGHPMTPPIAGSQHCITSDGIWKLKQLPEHLVIVGGGYIAVEFASIFAALGSRVSMLVRSRLLRTFDNDLSDELAAALTKQGVELHLGAVVERITGSGDDLTIEFADEHGEHRESGSMTVCYAIGRRPNTQKLGLDEIGIKIGSRSEIIVDKDHVTSVPHIYAVGDVINRANLTPVAIKMGRNVADRVFAQKRAPVSYDNIPTAVFSMPPIGTVGLTELEARQQYGDRVQVHRSRFRPMLYTPLESDQKPTTLMKLLVDGESDRVLGCHMIGDDAPEIIQGFGVALKMGATKADFDATVAVHPSSAEEFVLM